jgi:alpha-L-arabinofuranosidase
MSITFTKQEFATLIQLVFYGDAILHSTVENEADMNEEVVALKHKIYSKAKDFELGNWVDKNNPNAPELLQGKEEEFLEDLYRYEEAVFWDNLIGKLVERDMVAKYNLGTIVKMNEEEVMAKEEPIRQFYYEAFNRMGVKKLFLKG